MIILLAVITALLLLFALSNETISEFLLDSIFWVINKTVYILASGIIAFIFWVA